MPILFGLLLYYTQSLEIKKIASRIDDQQNGSSITYVGGFQSHLI